MATVGLSVKFFLISYCQRKMAEKKAAKVPPKPTPKTADVTVEITTSKNDSGIDKMALVEGVQFQDSLGEGAFGVVYKGVWINSITVALRTFKNRNQMEKVCREISILKSLIHPNVVPYLGIFIPPKDDSKMVLVMEYMAHNTLPHWLSEQKEETVSVGKLLRVCRDICAAMLYLTSKNVIHGSLAARNVFVVQQDSAEKKSLICVKVGDFGLCPSSLRVEELCSNEIARKCFPLRWTAPEVLADASSRSEKSDVYSFGIVVWELFNFGKATPFGDVDNAEIVQLVKSGGRLLERPQNCPEDVYSKLLCSCWKSAPSDRSTFKELSESVDSLCKVYSE